MGDAGSDGRATLRDIFVAARDPALSPQEVRLWLLYRYLERPERGGFMGDEKLGHRMWRKPRAIQDYRASLLEKGYLRQQLRGPKPAAYRAVVPEGREEEVDQLLSRLDDGEDLEYEELAEGLLDREEGQEGPPPEDDRPWGIGEVPTLESWNGQASSYFAEGVQTVLWRGKQPPPDAPDGWSMGADLKRLKVVWSNLGTASTVRRLWGLRYLAEDGELSCRGQNGDLRRLEPDEGFTLGLLEHFRERGMWEDAERRFRDRHDGDGGDELAAAVEFAQARGGEA